jgi:hypothetical protein
MVIPTYGQSYPRLEQLQEPGRLTTDECINE